MSSIFCSTGCISPCAGDANAAEMQHAGMHSLILKTELTAGVREGRIGEGIKIRLILSILYFDTIVLQVDLTSSLTGLVSLLEHTPWM